MRLSVSITAVLILFTITTSPLHPAAAEDQMLKVRSQQMNEVARAIFIEKLDAAFLRDVPHFADFSKDERKLIFTEVISYAAEKGIRSEQGIASYALAILWLGPDFEKKSKELETLLNSDYPEVRKVHGMNEWVNAALGDPGNIAAADQKLKQALELSKPWGK